MNAPSSDFKSKPKCTIRSLEPRTQPSNTAGPTRYSGRGLRAETIQYTGCSGLSTMLSQTRNQRLEASTRRPQAFPSRLSIFLYHAIVCCLIINLMPRSSFTAAFRNIVPNFRLTECLPRRMAAVSHPFPSPPTLAVVPPLAAQSSN